MTLEQSIRILAGTLVLVSVALAHYVSPWWSLLTIFIGFNLVQSSFTKFCPAEMIFKRLFFSDRKDFSGQAENA